MTAALQHTADSVSTTDHMAGTVEGRPITIERIRFSDPPYIPEEMKEKSFENAAETGSDLFSADLEGQSTDDEWSPRLLPHEIGLSANTNVAPPVVRRSSSCPSLLVFEWKPSSAFEYEDEDGSLGQWNIDIENAEMGDEQLSRQHLPDLKNSGFDDDVDPLSKVNSSMEPNKPSDVEFGITWSSLKKVNNKLVQWSFSGDEQSQQDNTTDHFVNEHSSSLSIAPKISPATDSRAEPSPPPTHKSKPYSLSPKQPAIKKTTKFTVENTPEHKGSNMHNGEFLAVPCFRGLRDSISIARSRSQPRNAKKVGNEIDPPLLQGTEEKLRLTKIAEAPKEQIVKPMSTEPSRGLCCLTMTGLEKSVEPRQDSVTITMEKIPASPKDLAR